MFVDEFSAILESDITLATYPIYLGDFNIHVNKPTDSLSCEFLDLLHSHGLDQLVSGSTHTAGNTLDLVICNKELPDVGSVKVEAPSLSDHSLVTFFTDTRQTVPSTYRNFRDLCSIDLDELKSDILSSAIYSSTTDCSDQLSHTMEQELK